MSDNINYSIIIPHKNTPELLQRCLNSIPHREDLQIIVVDDNSDPEMIDISNFPGSDNPIAEIIFTKEGKGAGYARNIGLSKATGKWLVFADSDDYFMDGFLNVTDKYKDSDYDLVYFGILGIDSNTKNENHIGKYYTRLLKNAVNNSKYDKYKYSNWNPWGKLVRSSLVKDNNILFDETKASNDKMFSLKAAFYSKNTFFVLDKIYVYETRKGSLITNNSLDLNIERLQVTISANRFLISNGKYRYRENITRRFFILFNTMNLNYFFKGVRLLKGNYFLLFIDIIFSLIMLPLKIFKKLIKIFFIK